MLSKKALVLRLAKIIFTHLAEMIFFKDPWSCPHPEDLAVPCRSWFSAKVFIKMELRTFGTSCHHHHHHSHSYHHCQRLRSGRRIQRSAQPPWIPFCFATAAFCFWPELSTVHKRSTKALKKGQSHDHWWMFTIWRDTYIITFPPWL